MMKCLQTLTLAALAGSAVSFTPSTKSSSSVKGPMDASSIEQNEYTTTEYTVTATPTKQQQQQQPQGPSQSVAIPFLKSSQTLMNAPDMAGNFGFDPMGFANNKDDLLAYREAEIKHSRLAMLAAAGWPVSELLDRPIADAMGAQAALMEDGRVPSVLNGGLDSISPVWWGSCLGLTAAIDMYGNAKARSGDPSYTPGRLGFDPLNLYPEEKEGQDRMELAEVKHGRLAMVAITSFAVQEYATKMGVVEETPFFLQPAML